MKSNKEIVEIANEPSLWQDLMWISDHLSNLFYYPIIQGGGQELYEKESIQCTDVRSNGHIPVCRMWKLWCFYHCFKFRKHNRGWHRGSSRGRCRGCNRIRRVRGCYQHIRWSERNTSWDVDIRRASRTALRQDGWGLERGASGSDDRDHMYDISVQWYAHKASYCTSGRNRCTGHLWCRGWTVPERGCRSWPVAGSAGWLRSSVHGDYG